MQPGYDVSAPVRNESNALTGLVLPEGSSVISAAGHGASFWSQSGKIDVRLLDGQNESYFIKVRNALFAQ